MKVLIIDPWGNGNSSYLHGIAEGLSKKINLCLVTSRGFHSKDNIKIKKIFFPISDRLKGGFFRRMIRGGEYILAYLYIIFYIRKSRFDVIHVQWLLWYKLDVLFLRCISLFCPIVYTAHNAIPHIKSSSNKELEKIYKIVDKIIVHGGAIKRELLDLFQISTNKINIIPHGAYINVKKTYIEDEKIRGIKRLIQNYNRVFLFEGYIFYNKGVDRLVKIWIDDFACGNELLIIAGKVNEDYKEFTTVKSEMNIKNNILYIPGFIEENLMTFLMQTSDVFVLPYRHASMSGVIFSAAAYKKAVLSTKVGAIPEYIIDNETGFLCSNNDQALRKKISEISSVPKTKLIDVGEALFVNVMNEYNWNKISDETLDVYQLIER
ncbi:putative glycosyl transferase family 1 protein [Selenomonas ruminantium subsp. lactilytica TAM6421]|uniref:Putative glycosyl transferase family 1 protein n=1 Tax=Selenomonas ruminantium subsp. lactilytica (strain NBRC 103574 / TAM6421) TaxID=927704 RepID=I0GNE9_SELRL|nr:glycosyltransferase family 4 protein [Selenomonas ruminantium]BAL82286.1 putative glycosyl transferase family 1 protein [Selenomonas ruminantium subsp. lactilytica TAM6421]